MSFARPYCMLDITSYCVFDVTLENQFLFLASQVVYKYVFVERQIQIFLQMTSNVYLKTHWSLVHIASVVVCCIIAL